MQRSFKRVLILLLVTIFAAMVPVGVVQLLLTQDPILLVLGVLGYLTTTVLFVRSLLDALDKLDART